MKKIVLLLTLSLLLVSCGGTTRSGVTSGILFTSWNDTVSGAVNNSIEFKKRGEACSTNIFGIIATGDSSVEAAKRAGGITKVAVSDTSYFNVFFGIFQKGCTVVKGE